MSILDSVFRDKIIKALTQAANEVVIDAKQNADRNNLPKEVAESISAGKVESRGNGSYSISITVDLDTAPMARAYEYGSGEHGDEGKAYKIPAGELGYLAFPLARWPNYRPPPNVKKTFVFPGMVSSKDYVMHPGVEAKPFLQPAIDDNLQDIGRLFSPLLKLAFKDVEPRVVFIKSDK